MKKIIYTAVFVLVVLGVSAKPAWAPLVHTFSDDSSSSGSSDSSVVDLSDRDTDAPTWSPSFENATSGGPIESE